MASRFGWRRTVSTLARYPVLRLAGFPTIANLELTRRCNAACDFCRYPGTRQDDRLDDYVPLVRRLKPMAVSLSGGEPLLRRDLERIVARLRAGCPNVFIALITNGSLLTVERGLALWRAGLDQITVSLDFLDERHDAARGIPGLARHITSVLPRLSAAGVDRLVVESMIRAETLDEIPAIVRWAEAHHLKVSLSAHTAIKSGNASHNVGPAELEKLRGLVDWLVAHKRGSGTILSSSYYLRRVPGSFAAGVPGCCAGRRFVDVRPDGFVQPCHDHGAGCWYQAWTRGSLRPPRCSACWCSCRGENEAPLDWERIRFAVAAYFSRPGSSPAALSATLQADE